MTGLDSGSYPAQANAANYQALSKAVNIPGGGRTDTVDLAMVPVDVAGAGTTTNPQIQVQTPNPRNSQGGNGNAPAVVRDSGQVRMSIEPNYADILVDGTKVGTGRKVVDLPIGQHTITFSAPGCTLVPYSLQLNKGDKAIVNQKMDCK